MKGWLDKYVPKAQNGIEGTMGGLTDKGFNYSPAWGGQFQDGGYVDSVLNANKHLDWVQRLYEKNTPSIQIPGQKGRSTHFMESGDGRVYPTVVKMPGGKLKYLGKDAYDYADSTKTYIQFPSDKEAQWFGKNYKKGKGVLSGFQMGGSLPGAVGFTYARTAGAAPSEGPYAKKTMPSAQNGAKVPVIEDEGSFNKDGVWIPDWEKMTAQAKKLGAKKVRTKNGSVIYFNDKWEVSSVDDNPDAKAQNGQEMKYYQEGLDFQPRTISQKGSIIPADNRARGDMQSYYPQIARMKDTPQRKALAEAVAKREQQERARRIIESQPSISQYTPNKELEAANRYKFAKQYAATHGGHADDEGNIEETFVDRAMDSKTAAKAWDNIVVPGINAEMLVSGAGLVGQGLKAAGKYAVENTALKNAYNLNPWRFKANPNAFYHRSPSLKNIVNQEKGILQGFGASEEGKLYSQTQDYYPGTKLNLRKAAHSEMYYSKGTPLDYGRTNRILDEKTGKMIPGQGYEGPYLVEVTDVPFVAKANGKYQKVFNPETGQYVRGELPPSGIGRYAVPKRPVSLNEAKFYKEHWLKGYKEVPKPTTAEDLVDLYRVQEKEAKTFAQLAAEGKIPKVFNNPEVLARKAAEEKYFGQWFTNNKADIDWYMKDREFTNPEIIQLRVPKSKLSQYQNYDKTLSRAPEREFVIPHEEQKIYKQKEGGVIKDDRGQWAHPGEITQIDSNDITMQGVPYPVLGIGADGQRIMMEPGEDYRFNKGPVTEIPMAKGGISVNNVDAQPLKKLDQLTNFTNYNKPTKGGWLDKYN